jgi:hypothetical protein
MPQLRGGRMAAMTKGSQERGMEEKAGLGIQRPGRTRGRTSLGQGRQQPLPSRTPTVRARPGSGVPTARVVGCFRRLHGGAGPSMGSARAPRRRDLARSDAGPEQRRCHNRRRTSRLLRCEPRRLRGHDVRLAAPPATRSSTGAPRACGRACTQRRDTRALSRREHHSRPFFERHGFTVDAEQHPVRAGVELTNYKMRKELR